MGLEAANFIDGLDQTWPTGIDPINKGDDHIRLVKKVIKDTFPGAGGDGFAEAIVALEADLNNTTGSTSNFQDQITANADAIVVNADAIQAVIDTSAPIGAIVMFNAAFAGIPVNWQLCDGTNGTPDLTNQFVYGTNTEGELKDSGGSADAIVPEHTHSATQASHTHTLDAATDFQGVGNRGGRTASANQGFINPISTVTPVITVVAAGESAIGANVPNYIKLAHIQRMT